MGRLGEVAGLFLRLGFTAFGGPAAHIALMEDEVVNRRKWIDRQQFLDLVAAVNFIPGPNSTEMAIHLGMLRAGWKGLIVAGICFITPAMLIILPIGWLYVHYSSLPNVTRNGTPILLAWSFQPTRRPYKRWWSVRPRIPWQWGNDASSSRVLTAPAGRLFLIESSCGRLRTTRLRRLATPAWLPRMPQAPL